jgi:hypothetical protein
LKSGITTYSQMTRPGMVRLFQVRIAGAEPIQAAAPLFMFLVRSGIGSMRTVI